MESVDGDKLWVSCWLGQSRGIDGVQKARPNRKGWHAVNKGTAAWEESNNGEGEVQQQQQQYQYILNALGGRKT